MVPEASSASIDGAAFRGYFLLHAVVWSCFFYFFRPFFVADFVDDIGSDPSTFSSTMALLTILLLVWSLFRQQIRQQRFCLTPGAKMVPDCPPGGTDFGILRPKCKMWCQKRSIPAPESAFPPSAQKITLPHYSAGIPLRLHSARIP